MSFQVDPQEDPSLVASLNNTAAHEILNGSHVKAVKMLSVALKQTYRFLRYSSNDLPESQDDDKFTVSQPQRAFCSFMSPGTCCRLETEDKHEWFLFQRPLKIVYKYEACTSNNFTRSVAEIFSHSIVYNLALCHHLIGLRISEACKRANHLRRAVALYEQAKRLLFKQSELHNTHWIAIFNNLGHVNDILGNKEASKRSFRQVLIIISSIATAAPGQELSSSQWLQMDGFLRNAFQAVSGSAATVAGAA